MHTYANRNEELQETGRQLANYQACSEVAENINDLALYRYFDSMFEDAASDVRFYPLNESEIVFRAFFKSTHLLKKIDSANLASLCLSRFDRLSRQMQDAKIAQQAK